MSTYTLDPERNNEGGGLMAAGILKGGELVAIAGHAGEAGLAEIVAKLSERKTVHEWLNAAGIPLAEKGEPICLLRRLRIACDKLTMKEKENAPRLEQVWQSKAEELAEELAKTKSALSGLLHHYTSVANVRNRRVIVDEEAAVIAARKALSTQPQP